MGGVLLTNQVLLKDLFIGSIDGETEASRGDFEQLFYTKNSKFDEIMRPEKFIISGRKGTGKTILAKYVHKKVNEKPDSYCKIFTKNDYVLRKLIDTQFREMKPEELSIFWKWTLLYQISDTLNKKVGLRKKIPFTAEYKLAQFLKNIYPDDIFKVKDVNKSFGIKNSLKGDAKKKGLSELAVTAAHENTAQVSTNYLTKEYFELISQLEELLYNCLKKEKEIVLIYDDLDELDEKFGDDSKHYQTLISMLETIKDLNIVFKSLSKKNTKIVVLLRSDIIDEIHKHSSNSNKLVTESEVNLYWIEKRSKKREEHPLMEMVLNKVQKSAEQYSSINKAQLYKMLFPRRINHKDAIVYLLDYSLGRPRDIIRHLNLVIEDSPEATNFDPAAFRNCAQKYSKWFYDELQNEISIHKNREMLRDGLRLINDMKKITFTYDLIKDHFTQKKEHYANIEDLKETISHLYKLGVIGNSWQHKNSDNYHFSWGYRDDASNDPNFSQTFVVHSGLRNYFSI
ncbi:FunZ [Bacillus thuringiensis]|nr:FunZ [Bacillus thuringiensis]